MINRIREVRKARGMTLEDVARRCAPPTTAQTIGRLETGMRTLSIDWLNRIAAALGVDGNELIGRPDDPVLPVVAQLTGDGARALDKPETMPAPVPGDRSMALRVVASSGEFRAGDTLWLRELGRDEFAAALNRDILVPRPAGRFLFGRLIGLDGTKLQILPPGSGQRQQIVSDPAWLAVVERLIRVF